MTITKLQVRGSPNPLSANTVIEYYLPENASAAYIYLYDMQGIQLKRIDLTQRGKSQITVSGSELHPGMFLYALIVDGKEIDTKRMILTE